MGYGINPHAWSNPCVVADGDECHVEDGHIVIGQKIVAHVQVDAQVAEEARLDAEILTGGAEQLAQHFLTFFTFCNGQRIELLAELCGSIVDFRDFGVIHAVMFPIVEFF